MKKCISLLVSGILASTLWVHAASLPDNLITRTRAAALQAQTAGLYRFAWMRFYVPTDMVRKEPGLLERWFSSKFEQQHERALAFYLFNMYVSTHLYKEPAPQALSLNYIGVLDGFEMCQEPFDFARATTFYQKHKTAILAQFTKYLRARQHPWNEPTEEDFVRWVALLQTLPYRQGQGTYLFPTSCLITVPWPNTQTLLSFALKTVRAQAAQLVILYDQPDLKLEDLDSRIGNHTPQRKLTYRPVKDECYYNSYLTAHHLVHTLLQNPPIWESSHVYLITAYPQQGEFLSPAAGDRFILAQGNPGLHWRYHTAVLLVLKQKHQFYTLIIDPFLEGEEPIDIGKWLGRFSPRTVFRVQPFVRNETVEKALVKPEVTDGNRVWVNGHAYEPAPVLK